MLSGNHPRLLLAAAGRRAGGRAGLPGGPLVSKNERARKTGAGRMQFRRRSPSLHSSSGPEAAAAFWPGPAFPGHARGGHPPRGAPARLSRAPARARTAPPGAGKGAARLHQSGRRGAHVEAGGDAQSPSLRASLPSHAHAPGPSWPAQCPARPARRSLLSGDARAGAPPPGLPIPAPIAGPHRTAESRSGDARRPPWAWASGGRRWPGPGVLSPPAPRLLARQGARRSRGCRSRARRALMARRGGRERGTRVGAAGLGRGGKNLSRSPPGRSSGLRGPST